MPPKSKAAKAAATTKKPRSASQTAQSKPAKTTKVEAPPVAGKRPKIDKRCNVGGQIYQDEDGCNWSVMLNQTNIGGNNNKFYVIQLIEKSGGGFSSFTCWGRIGEPGQNATVHGDLASMKKSFSDKFKDKTKNNWDAIRQDHTGFKKFEGKYMLIETAVDDDEPAAPAAASTAGGPPAKVAPSKLKPQVQSVLKFIFDKDMFKAQMKTMNIDANKMPLGKLTKAQVEAGYEALEAVEDGIKKGVSNDKLASLTSTFYTIIPHDFGRTVPPVIRTSEAVQQKYDLLNTLNDIQVAVAMEAAAGAKQTVMENPIDAQYTGLNCKLDLVDPTTDEFKIIDNYTKNTQGYRKCKIIDAFRVDRPEDKQRIAKFKNEKNRFLGWHGTNVAVVAAILKTGLRILPSSGWPGRVGKGLYFASENGKSAGYVRCEGKTGFMFLCEVVLGDSHFITKDDSSLTFNKVEGTLKKDSVIAKGWTEPDPKDDIMIQGEWQPIRVPQGKVIKMPQNTGSSFSQSEYLVYQEARVRIKYLLKMEF